MDEALRILIVIDEYTQECLALRVARRLGSLQVTETLADVMSVRGIPEHIRSDNGPEFIAEELRKWLDKLGTRHWATHKPSFQTGAWRCGKRNPFPTSPHPDDD